MEVETREDVRTAHEIPLKHSSVLALTMLLAFAAALTS